MAAPAKKPPVRMRYDDPDQKKPNPNGLFNDQGFMDRVPGKAPSIQSAAPASTIPQPTTDAARAAAQAKLVAEGNRERARLAAQKQAPLGATPLAPAAKLTLPRGSIVAAGKRRQKR